MTVRSALERRRSIRRFLPDPVPEAVLRDLLAQARLAPSGANLQPGTLHVLTGRSLKRLVGALTHAFDHGELDAAEYAYFPERMPGYLKARQRAVGYALYNSLGIERRDIPARKAQHRRNFEFFAAPVGMIVTIDRDMGPGCYMDLGMMLQSLFLAATEANIDSCGIGALAQAHAVIRSQLDLPEDQVIVCGIALGYGDHEAPENRFPVERLPLAEFARFHTDDQAAGSTSDDLQ